MGFDKKRVLLIDDEADFTELLKLTLSKLGYEVASENCPNRALATARNFLPDIVFLDVIMPGMSGAQVACQLRADRILKSTPVIFLTATVDREEVQGAVGKIDNHAVMAKPPSTDELVECIERFLSKENAGAGD